MTISSSNQRRHKHIFPIIDAMVDEAIHEIKENGEKISCRAGCDHCCHLLVEVNWEEAVELAEWVSKQRPKRQAQFRENIGKNAEEARKLFKNYKRSKKFTKPFKGEQEIPDHLFDRYFYGDSRPCPFLENKSCAAYEARPLPCRLHLVSSHPKFCGRDIEDETHYHIPDRLEKLKKEVEPVITAVQPDERWGHLGIMVEAALKALDKAKKIPTKRRSLSHDRRGNKEHRGFKMKKVIGL